MTDHHDQQARELLAEACGASSFLDLGIAVSVTQALRAITAALRMGGKAEYDRELIADMLGQLIDMLGGDVPEYPYSTDAVEAQIEALRAADNRDAAGVDDPLRMRLIDLLFTEAAAQTETGITGLADKILAMIDTPAAVPAGGEAVAPFGWYTDDHDIDRSATTYDPVIADRWRAKGWPVYPLYTAPQAAQVQGEDFVHHEYTRGYSDSVKAAQVQQEAVCVRCGDKPAGALCGGLTLAALIQFGKQAANPGQGATRWHMIDLIGQMVPHLEALATHPAAGDKVRELVAKWRSDADDDMRMNLPLAASVASACADELEAALAQAPAVRVTDEMARRAEIVREQSLRKIASYGSAGVEERHNMAMHDALEAVLGQGKA